MKNKIIRIKSPRIQKFSNAEKAKNKFLNTIKDTDPQLARAFDNWENDFQKLMANTRKIYVKHGMDTTELDKLVKSYKG